jgi:hypothetical protein
MQISWKSILFSLALYVWLFATFSQRVTHGISFRQHRVKYRSRNATCKNDKEGRRQKLFQLLSSSLKRDED